MVNLTHTFLNNKGTKPEATISLERGHILFLYHILKLLHTHTETLSVIFKDKKNTYCQSFLAFISASSVNRSLKCKTEKKYLANTQSDLELGRKRCRCFYFIKDSFIAWETKLTRNSGLSNTPHGLS